MDQATLITQIVAALEPDPRIRGLFLSGSFGRGTADAFSDVDLLAVVPTEAREAIAADWRSVMETIARPSSTGTACRTRWCSTPSPTPGCAATSRWWGLMTSPAAPKIG